jgi:ABC-2 type transport system permease protein
MRHYLSLVTAAIRLQYLSWFQYRADYSAGLLTVVIEQALTLTLFWVIFSNVTSVAGWSLGAMLMIYGFTRIAFGIADAFTENLWFIASLARSGELMDYRFRPLGVLFQLLCERIWFERLASCIVGVALLAYGSVAASLTWTPLGLLQVGVYVLMGVLVYLGILILGAALSVVFIGQESGPMAALFSLTEFAKYPSDIYGRLGSLLVTFLVPLGLIGFVPTAALLDPTAVPVMLPPVVLALVVGSGFFALCAALWGLALRGYQGTGS